MGSFEKKITYANQMIVDNQTENDGILSSILPNSQASCSILIFFQPKTKVYVFIKISCNII